MVMNYPRVVVINEEIQKKVTEFEHILIAVQVNKDDMTIAQFKTYLSADGGNWLIPPRPLSIFQSYRPSATSPTSLSVWRCFISSKGCLSA